MEENKHSNSQDRPAEESSLKLPICRICYDTEKENNLLIHPCRCTGSVKYVHEECLKTWLLSTNEDLNNRACELCHTTFQMEYKIISYFSLREICDETIGTCMFIPILLSILALIVVIIYFLAVKYEDPDTDRDDKVYSLALMAGCSFAGGIILIILVFIIKSTFIKVKMDDWHIKNQEFTVEIAEKPLEEHVAFTSPNEVLSGNILVLPKVALIKGKKIKAPKVVPISLIPCYEGEKLIGYKSEVKDVHMMSCALVRCDDSDSKNQEDLDRHNMTL
jgi:hypothetical protein